MGQGAAGSKARRVAIASNGSGGHAICQAWVRVLPVVLASCKMLGKLRSLPRFHLSVETEITTRRVLRELTMCVRLLAQCLVPSARVVVAAVNNNGRAGDAPPHVSSNMSQRYPKQTHNPCETSVLVDKFLALLLRRWPPVSPCFMEILEPSLTNIGTDHLSHRSASSRVLGSSE